MTEKKVAAKFSRADFSEWYHSVLDASELIDSRYNLKGCYVWRPFGFQMRKLVFGFLAELMESTGHGETMFPLLIPEDQFMKEADFIKGFEDGVYWVTKGGLTDLDVKLAIRPTSETAIYPMFKLWVRSHADLPLKIFQIVNTFRYETKHTRPLIRDREITTFKEAHCAHADQAQVAEEMALIKGAYTEFFDALSTPCFMVERPDWDRFPGAVQTIAWDCIMPDYKTLQVATSHDLGTEFAKAFEVSYAAENGEQKLCHITCHGISSRALAPLIGIHGDERGLVLPPKFAPIQAVVVPILFKDSEDVIKAAKHLFGSLDCRKELDLTNETPGNKFYKWELKGVPVRIEIGPKDLEKEQAVLVRRDNGAKKAVPLKDVKNELHALFEEITKDMHEKAWTAFHAASKEAKTKEELLERDSAELPTVVNVCGDKDCWREVEGGMPHFEFRGTIVDAKGEGKCIGCGRAATRKGLFSTAY